MSNISLIAALSENRVIGVDNKLPWHIPEDLKRFKRLTYGYPIIMGRKTFESIGRVLPGRKNIIITRDKKYSIDGAVIVHSFDEAIQRAANEETDEIFVIGGGQIFEQAIDKADQLYLTLVHTTLEGDAYFPEYSHFTKVISEEKGQSDEWSYTFLDLEK